MLAELRQKSFLHYAMCLFAPAAHRTDYAALFLLAAELEQICHQVSEPLLGQIRLQWWHDGITAPSAELPPHLLLQHIASWRERGFNISPLEDLIAAHQRDLLAEPFPNLSDYHDYQTRRAHAVSKMIAAIVSPVYHGTLHDEAMNHYQKITMVHDTATWLKRRAMPLPPEWLTAYAIAPTALAEMQPQASLQQWAIVIATEVLAATQTTRAALLALPRSERGVAMISYLHNQHASRLARRIIRNGGKLYGLSRPASVSPWRLLLAMGSDSIRLTYLL